MAEEECPKCPPEGLPAWMGTFADLMSLLMCFFVLLLSFSEMDVLKFKQIAGSMKFAFGVQNKIEVKDIPKGTSVIAMEFRPGKPDPTPIESIQQQTNEMTQQMLEFQAGNEDSAGGRQKQRGEQRGGQSQQTATQSSSSAEQSTDQSQMAELMKKVAQQLEKQILDGSVEMESLGQQLTIRIRENGSFSAGSAFLQPQFQPVLRKIGTLLADVPGEIEISGHSDGQHIANELYRSNWDLSSQRAVAVAEAMRTAPGFDESRMSVVGKADTAPIVENATTSADRAKNRRVEININQGKPMISKPISVVDE
ncbi:flagellar motor protein MotB [Alteromonas mediterranea]|jgi:chemotaxis protein MotB|uniref:Flagellar motor protein MotB n=7 Tax=Alteromonas TaxID=226 RepID=A0AAC9JDD0_9ALTE|nr:flagellar motor protein MotB [Alteromonas mediterranea]AGP78574.1 flagellar motor protein MotB [Alteromonas mediterranea 615]AGP94248.1 flagellar motor protein MotB [Alteromonas mediterranea U8]MBR9784556.1 flagellar motor protein MotB [Gammaproteobacteria bacterium]MEA3380744.1 flagellar motor protein MotB [Pseudomonadota bacterium]AEA98615.1 flagellar motor protein MotB [Alteromonas mediterranea DE]|tara:strand:- start:5325 stop:6254 length:930 start_codon:yes stop_codon:yes gene_type:complete